MTSAQRCKQLDAHAACPCSLSWNTAAAATSPSTPGRHVSECCCFNPQLHARKAAHFKLPADSQAT